MGLDKVNPDNTSGYIKTENISLSMKNLDQTFNSHRSKVNYNDKESADEYIFDIENTWILNLGVLINVLSSTDMKMEERNLLRQQIKKLKNIFMFKKKLRDKKTKLSGKVLIDKQIYEEKKRNIEEITLEYVEKMNESRINYDRKLETIMHYEKKLKEVEVFVHRMVKKEIFSDNYINWSIQKYINDYIELMIRKNELKSFISKKEEDIRFLYFENADLKLLRGSNDDDNDIIEVKLDPKMKYWTIVKIYQHNVEFLQSLIDKLKRLLQNLYSRSFQLSIKSLKRERKSSMLSAFFQDCEIITEKSENNSSPESISINSPTKFSFKFGSINKLRQSVFSIKFEELFEVNEVNNDDTKDLKDTNVSPFDAKK